MPKDNHWLTKEFNGKNVLVRQLPSGIWYAIVSADDQETISHGVTWQIAAEHAFKLHIKQLFQKKL